MHLSKEDFYFEQKNTIFHKRKFVMNKNITFSQKKIYFKRRNVILLLKKIIPEARYVIFNFFQMLLIFQKFQIFSKIIMLLSSKHCIWIQKLIFCKNNFYAPEKCYLTMIFIYVELRNIFYHKKIYFCINEYYAFVQTKC